MKLALALTCIAATVATTSAIQQHCDNGIVGSGVCKNPNDCCSKWGWCGTTSTHCDPASCVSGPNCPNSPDNTTPPPTEPTIPATPAPTSVPVEPTPTPVEPTPAPVEPTPAPIEPTPAPVDPTPAPVEPTPAPIEPTPAPVEPTPAPVEPTPAPATPAPITKPTSSPTPSPTDPLEPAPPSGTPCGNGAVGNGICENPCECCSGWGWCSSLPAHCAADTCISSPDNSCTRPEAIFHEFCNRAPTDAPMTTPEPTSGTTEAPVPAPTESPISTSSPTSQPTPMPSPAVPTVPVTPAPIAKAPPTSIGGVGAVVEAVLEGSKDGIDNSLFMYETPSGQWEPSSVYRYSGFLQGLRVMYQQGVNGKLFYMGDDSANGHEYGLVNIASFLAQSMKETIKYDACDENSWDVVNGVYPLSNACGQLGQSYEDYHCSEEEAYMECPVDPSMSITATTNAKWYGAPGPLKCGPKEEYPVTGFWDHTAECNKPWDNPPSYCEAYEGQVAGAENNEFAIANQNGRDDVEGCCWWGRGVIQTTGVCNFGKLNYFLGKRAFDDGRESPYPTVDFCQDPGAICASEEFTELKWIAGMFYWMESVQTYDSDGWNYMTELHQFVDGGMTDDSFVNAVSGIVNRGCHNPPCASGPVDGEADRRDNFHEVLKEFGLKQRRRGLRA